MDDFDKEVANMVYRGTVGMLRNLVDTDSREEGEKYQHALETTAMNNDIERAKVLLEAGASVSHDAMKWAENNRSSEVMSLFKQYGYGA